MVRYKTPESVLVWLMYEILSARRELIAECLTAIYQQEKSSKKGSVCDWPFAIVKRVWKKLVGALLRTPGRAAGQHHSRITIIIDGVDQCLGGQDQLRRLKEFFVCITEDPTFRLLVFSRPSSDLSDIEQQRGFVGYLIKDQDTKADILVTVKEGARWVARLHRYGEDMEARIVDKVEGKAKGMYLWATTVLEELKRQRLSSSQLEEFLNNLPPTIIELYDLILGRSAVLDTESSSSEANGANSFVRRVLFWIAYQLHGMDEEEMWTGICLLGATERLLPQRKPTHRITEADVRVVPRATNVKRDISRGCGALVTFTEDDTFAAAHSSVQEFLVTPTETLRQSYPRLRHHQNYYCGGLQPDDIIRQLCTNYLLLSYFSDPENNEAGATWADKVQRRVGKHPFSRYTARSWFKHANMSDHQIDSRGHVIFTAGSDQQRLLTPEDPKSEDWKCSRSWMEIWWYYEKPGQDFPTDGISSDVLGSGEILLPRVQWVVGTPDDTRKRATPSPLPRTAQASPPSRASPEPAPQQWEWRSAPAPVVLSPSLLPPPLPPLPPPPPSSHPPSPLPSYPPSNPPSHPLPRAPPSRTLSSRAPSPPGLVPPPQIRRVRDPPPRREERSPSPSCCRRWFCCCC